MKLFGWRINLIIFLLLGAASPFWARAGELDDIVDKVQAQYDRINDFSAEFEQYSRLSALGRTKVSRGKAFFKKPGMMRWDYEGKDGQKIISDGYTLWLYFPEDNQVQLGQFSRVWAGRTPTAFLAGVGNLRQDFEVSFTAEKKTDAQGNYLLLLKSKEALAQLNQLVVAVDKQSYLLVGTSFTDRLGNLTQIKFKNIRINQGPKNSLFSFTIPPDVDVLKISPPE